MRSLLLKNAVLPTVDPLPGRSGSIVVVGDTIKEIIPAGRDAEAEHSYSQVIDCRGRAVLPGFIDAHLHLTAMAHYHGGVDLSPSAGVLSLGDLQRCIREQARKTPDDTWVRGHGYNEFYLAEKRHPTRRDLDAGSPRHPVKITHRSGHAHVLNSRALELVGISLHSEEPPGGLIDRELPSGEPSGLLFEMGPTLARLIPEPEEQALLRGAMQANQRLLSSGITSLHDATAGNGLEQWRAMERWRDQGIVQSRVSVMVGWEGFQALKRESRDALEKSGQTRLRGLKIILDQSRGGFSPGQDELDAMVMEAHRAGWPVAIHAVEAEAVASACGSLEKALAEFPRPSHGHRIEHCSQCPPALARRLAGLGVMVVTQPAFLWAHGERYLETLGREDRWWLYPLRTLLESGVAVAGSSDAPLAPLAPLAGVQAAVTRLERNGQSVNSREKISLRQALNLYSGAGALAIGESSSRGAIAPGVLADLVVLDQDPFAVPADAIQDIKVEKTIIGGEVVWQA
ncbi:MAG: amidohydrolase [Desulfarculaceae bacterium]|nr:amidohydrolase [Desulfarculaceae bacterium]